VTKRDTATSALFEIAPERVTIAPAKPTYHALAPDPPEPFLALLAEYANGCDRRDEVATMIWQWDDPLGRQIRVALEAAERHGEWKARNF
jgi:hypothetical protein